MLPDKSTDNSRSRPVIGSATGSPTNCGRAAASSASIQTSHKRASRQSPRGQRARSARELGELGRGRNLERGVERSSGSAGEHLAHEPR